VLASFAFARQKSLLQTEILINLPSSMRIRSWKAEQRRRNHVRLLLFTHPHTIKPKPAIHSAGMPMASPHTAMGNPVRNRAFRNALSIAKSPLRILLIKP
jgi:hypothetical protein